MFHNDTIDVSDFSISPDIMPGTDEAIHADSEIKPPYYAVLGHIITPIVVDALNRPMTETKLPKLNRRSNNKAWRSLYFDVASHFKESIDTVMDDPTYQETTEAAIALHGMRVSLRSPGAMHGMFRLSIMGGSGSAASGSVYLLRDMHRKTFGSVDPEEHVSRLENSHGTLKEMTKTNALQLMIVNSLLDSKMMPPVVKDDRKNGYRYDRPILDTPINDVQRNIAYVNTGARFLDAKFVRDIKTNTVVIGCPVNFTPYVVPAIWKKTFSEANRRGMLS